MAKDLNSRPIPYSNNVQPCIHPSLVRQKVYSLLYKTAIHRAICLHKPISTTHYPFERVNTTMLETETCSYQPSNSELQDSETGNYGQTLRICPVEMQQFQRQYLFLQTKSRSFNKMILVPTKRFQFIIQT